MIYTYKPSFSNEECVTVNVKVFKNKALHIDRNYFLGLCPEANYTHISEFIDL
jgi:hypothetical protein